jgi:hypothetical protein
LENADFTRIAPARQGSLKTAGRNEAQTGAAGFGAAQTGKLGQTKGSLKPCIPRFQAAFA